MVGGASVGNGPVWGIGQGRATGVSSRCNVALLYVSTISICYRVLPTLSRGVVFPIFVGGSVLVPATFVLVREAVVSTAVVVGVRASEGAAAVVGAFMLDTRKVKAEFMAARLTVRVAMLAVRVVLLSMS